MRFEQEITTVITQWGTFCSNMMPFNLTNFKAAYQRVSQNLLHDMIYKEGKAYVDDMITKSKSTKGHVPSLIKCFKIL